MNPLNQIILEGNIVRQPEQKEIQGGSIVCTLPLAVNHTYKSKSGEKVEDVSFFDVDMFGELAEHCLKWCPKGREIRVVGRLKQNRWKDADGKSHSRVKIIAEHVEFLRMPRKAPDSRQQTAMLAEVAQAARHEQETEEVVF